jgi:hypothetical protein
MIYLFLKNVVPISFNSELIPVSLVMKLIPFVFLLMALIITSEPSERLGSCPKVSKLKVKMGQIFCLVS